MSKNQNHGKSFENQIKDALSASDTDTDYTTIFDITNMSEFIRGKKIQPISIKTSKIGSNNEIILYLSDAVRVWHWKSILGELNSKIKSPDQKSHESVRIILGAYKQEEEMKHITEIYDIELNLTSEACKYLYGDLKPDIVWSLHQGIGREFFKDPEDARKWIESKKEEIYSKDGGAPKIKLNQKIDSKTQRRMQCSISLSEILKTPDLKHKKYCKELEEESSYMGIKLPILIESSARERKKKN